MPLRLGNLFHQETNAMSIQRFLGLIATITALVSLASIADVISATTAVMIMGIVSITLFVLDEQVKIDREIEDE